MKLNDEIMRCIWQDSNVEWDGNIYYPKREDKILAKNKGENQKIIYKDIISVRRNFSKFRFEKDVSGIRFCLFSDIRKGDMFTDHDMVMALFMGKPLKDYFRDFRKFCKKNDFRYQIAKLDIYPGIKAKLVKGMVNDEETIYAGILEPETTFYATDVVETELYGEKITLVELGITFAAMEETYQKFKDDKNATMDDIKAFEEMN